MNRVRRHGPRRPWTFLIAAALSLLSIQTVAAAFDPPSFERSFDGPLGLSGPTFMAVLPSGNVLVVDSGNSQIQEFTSEGAFVGNWGESGTDPGEFSTDLGGIAVDDSGEILVVDTGNSRIQRFDADGTFISGWGSAGSGNGAFNHPAGIAFDNSGNVLVADCENYRIQKFAPSGSFISTWGSFGDGDGALGCPYGIAVMSDGTITVTEAWNSRVQQFDASGTFVRRWGEAGTDDGLFVNPTGIAIGDDGIYVVDRDNHRIQKFTFGGGYVGRWGEQGVADGHFEKPIGIALDGTAVYVADSDNDRVQKFDYIVATPCAPGSYSDSGDDAFGPCTPADFGYYVDIAGATDQTACPAGQTTASTGSTSSSDCYPPCATQPFSDVSTEHPFCTEIEWALKAGIATGFTDGTYKPSLSITRQAMSAFLARLAGDPLLDCVSPPFSDVPTGHPFCEEIKWMKDANISTGFPDGTFQPGATVTRQAMAAFLARLAGGTLSDCTSQPFTDVPTGHAFCKEIQWLKDAGISTGFPDGSFHPSDLVARQAMAAFLYRTARL